MTSPLTFQSVILKLQDFWAARGCVIWQPYYSQVGAGTMNPATALRVLGPEPWNVAYVEPSIRPDDGRYGENPNRLQQHYQFQVILKPDPGNPQEIYLDSLKAIGIDPRHHDIRFVEDNWESPALGAWGLGWEVWLDGQEITQFTYFQQAGGVPCEVVSVEITYGLERILIALQRVRGFRDIRWNEAVTYGDVNLQGEREHSRYYFELADVPRLRQMYDLYEAEARACLEAGLVLPAHDYVLKCSHAFNVLDTRGAIGVTERAAFFGRMRDLSRKVAAVYLEQRQRLEYPLMPDVQANRVDAEASQRLSPKPLLGRAYLSLEIGTEELPALDLSSAIGQLREYVPAMLNQARLDFGLIQVSGTPRRLAVEVRDLAPFQRRNTIEIKGPPLDRAYDEAGAPTNAAIGFARRKGIPIDRLTIIDTEGHRYVGAIILEEGQPAAEALAESLPNLLSALKFDKSMRWLGDENKERPTTFSRPIRWLVALHGSNVIPFEYAGLTAGRTSRGLRPFDSPEIEIADAQSYAGAMERAGIVLDVNARRERIKADAARLAAEVGGTIPDDDELLAEVANLVESPTAFRGEFEREYLDLPQAVLVSVMKKYQRYFPVLKGGTLLPYFIGVRNGDTEHLDLVIEGNEHVIRARFADADFFIREDVKKPLESYRSKLSTLTFQVKLGSMLDKTERIEKITAALAPMLDMDEAETAHALRAAHLCKADLATRMVVEMTSLQGVIGRVYALGSGEHEEVARAVYEHYLPAGTAPARPGLAVGLADRLDALVGLFAIGLAPTGAKDPFALRRAALSLAQILLSLDLSFDLRAGLEAAVKVQPVEVSEAVLAECLDYLKGRLRGLFIESGSHYDVVDAVLAERGHDPALARQAIGELSAWVAKPDWPQTLAAYARCVRITREFTRTFDLHPEAMTEPSEVALCDAYQPVARAVANVQTLDQFFTAFTPIIPAVSKFFDDVLVMHEDPAVRANRLGLLQRIAALTKGIADLSKLEGF